MKYFVRIWFFLIVFLNKPINRTNPNWTKPISLVRFLFWKTMKTEPIQIDEGFIGSDIVLTENQSKPNCYTPSFKGAICFGSTSYLTNTPSTPEISITPMLLLAKPLEISLFSIVIEPYLDLFVLPSPMCT